MSFWARTVRGLDDGTQIVAIPRNCRRTALFRGGGMSVIAAILSGCASIPFSMIILPIKFTSFSLN